MTRFHVALVIGAVILPLCLAPAVVQAQGGPSAGAPGQGYGGGYGPGMMGGSGPGVSGSGYGPGMMGSGYGPQMMAGYGAGMTGYGPGMMWGWGGPNWANDATTAGNFADAQLGFLKAELKITPQQAPQWDKFAATVAANARKMAGERGVLARRDGTNDSLPDRLELREEIMATALDSMRKTDAALKPLYAALDDNQKKLAEEFIGFPMSPLRGMF